MCIHASSCIAAAGASCRGAVAAYATQDQVADSCCIMCIHTSSCIAAAGARCRGAFAAYATQEQVAGTAAAALCASMRPSALRLLMQVA